MLEIRNLTKKFGGLTAVHDVSVSFEAGHINAIIGPNGAGKTTFFNLIAGTHAPSSGQILFKGRTWPACARTRSPGSGWRAPSRPRPCSTARRCSTT